VNWRDLKIQEFLLPADLDEQQRIADLLWSIERHRTSVIAVNGAVDTALQQMLAEEFASATGDERAIADLCIQVIGGVWGSPEGEDEVDVLALGPRVYAEGATAVTVDGSPVRSITARQAATRTVQEGDIVLERSGGSPTQLVGRVVIAGPDLPHCIPTDFQRLLRPDPHLVVPHYLYWRLRHDWAAGAPRDFSKKTTNISNLSVTPYLARKIRLPARTDQVKVLARIEDFEAAKTAVAAKAAAVANLQNGISASVFGGAK
jgi:type I restriction enzyme S subunit